MDCGPSGSSVHGIPQARILGVGCHFLEECCDVGPALKEKSGSLYQQYRAFSTENGEYKLCDCPKKVF